MPQDWRVVEPMGRVVGDRVELALEPVDGRPDRVADRVRRSHDLHEVPDDHWMLGIRIGAASLVPDDIAQLSLES